MHMLIAKYYLLRAKLNAESLTWMHVSTRFCLNSLSHPVKFRMALKDTLKSGQSSELDRVFRVGGPVMTSFGLITNSKKIGRLEPLSRLLSELVRN